MSVRIHLEFVSLAVATLVACAPAPTAHGPAHSGDSSHPSAAALSSGPFSSGTLGSGPLSSTAIKLNVPLASQRPDDVLERFLSHFMPNTPRSALCQLELARDELDAAGQRHFRYVQSCDGLEVDGAVLLLHLDGLRLTGFNSSLASFAQLRLKENLDERAARAQLEGPYGMVVLPGPLKARIVPSATGTGERAWRLLAVPSAQANADAASATQDHSKLHLNALQEVFISAVDGRLLEIRPLVLSLNAPSCSAAAQLDCSATAEGMGDDGRMVDFQVYRGDGFPLPTLLDGYLHAYDTQTYPDLYGASASDDSFFVDLSEADAQGGLYVVHSDGSIADPYATIFYDSGDAITFGPGTSFTDRRLYGASVSAMHTLKLALAYFSEVHRRAGVSGVPGAPVDIVARVGLRGLNAAWASEYNTMLFGEYAGTSLAIAQDVTGHELSHGVIQFSSGLLTTNQSGALNEAIADMFGVLVQEYASSRLDWWMGEAIPAFPPLRNLKHPEWFKLPGHMSEYVVTTSDSGGVHTNLSIPSKAFQLAIDGTPTDSPYYGYNVTPADPDRSIGTHYVAQVLYHTLLYRTTPRTEFADWALSMLGSVNEADLPASVQSQVYASLRDAFLATGILTDASGAALSALSGTLIDKALAHPIQNVPVRLSIGTQLTQLQTDEKGSFVFSLPSGTYSATVTTDAVGYYDQTRSITIEPLSQGGQDQTDLDFQLEPRPPARAELTPLALSTTLAAGSSRTLSLTLRNIGTPESELGWILEPSISYQWKEIPYVWEELVGVGTLVDLTGDQNHSAPLLLPAPFPFYFSASSSLYVSTDGYLTLEPDPTPVYREYPLPDARAPRALIAPWWADLDFGRTPRAYFHYDRQIATVQFEAVPDYPQEQIYTFQTALLPDGSLRFSYRELSGAPESWARVGIQDSTGLQGLEVAVSSPAVPASFPRAGTSLLISPSMPPLPGAVTVATSSGALAGGAATTLKCTVNSAGISPGAYRFLLRISSNDPQQPLLQVPVDVLVQ